MDNLFSFLQIFVDYDCKNNVRSWKYKGVNIARWLQITLAILSFQDTLRVTKLTLLNKLDCFRALGIMIYLTEAA
jgi:hypothetical protein